MSHWMPYCTTPFMRMMKRHMLLWMPGMITCEAFENFIADYLDDNLDAGQKRVFERHLRVCPECIDYLAAYNATRKLSKDSVQAHVETSVPDDLIKAVIDAASSSDQK